jgi:membrane protein required for colicin V production
MSVSTVDILVVATLAISTIIGILRGFVRETLSVFAWAAAIFATIYFGPVVSAALHPHISTPFLAAAIAYAGVFLVVLLPLTLLGHRISRGVHNSPVGAVDRFLGLGFGIVRGLALIGIAYLAFSMVVPARRQPDWLMQARTLPLIQKSSRVVLALVPSQFDTAFIDSDESPAAPPKPPSRQHAQGTSALHAQKTYGAQDRRALDRLIEATGGGDHGKP